MQAQGQHMMQASNAKTKPSVGPIILHRQGLSVLPTSIHSGKKNIVPTVHTPAASNAQRQRETRTVWSLCHATHTLFYRLLTNVRSHCCSCYSCPKMHVYLHACASCSSDSLLHSARRGETLANKSRRAPIRARPGHRGIAA